LDITAWLSSLGLQQYEPVFRENAVDIETLPGLTEADLEKPGVCSDTAGASCVQSPLCSLPR
jgi:SAM domain (Sterile alpha motif)